jgi:hypothetical protein
MHVNGKNRWYGVNHGSDSYSVLSVLLFMDCIEKPVPDGYSTGINRKSLRKKFFYNLSRYY